MPNVQIPIVGPTYTSRSLPVSSQVTSGFYLEINKEAETIASLMPFPGLKKWTTAGSGENRGMWGDKDTLYTITKNTLYSVDSNGTATSLGTIPGSGRCSMESDGTNLVICYGSGKPIVWDGSTLTTGTDADLPSASTVAYINNRVVYDGAGRSLAFADLGLPLSVSSKNVTNVDFTPDDTRAVITKDIQLFVFGDRSVTPYYNSGVGNPPYSVIQNAVETDLGIGAVHSLCKNKTYIYFLGSDRQVYRISGLQPEPVGNPAIGQAISKYSNIDNAYAHCFSFHNQEFYMLTFPGEATWLFSESAGWTNLSYNTTLEPSLISGYSNSFGRHIVGDRGVSGNLYELDFDTFQDNGKPIIRQRDTAKVTARALGISGREITMNRLEVLVETGVGVISGQGSDPQIMMQYSDDGGRSWSSERWRSIGVLGDYIIPVEWHDLGCFSERMFRFKVSDPVKIVLRSANADVEAGVV